MKSALHGRPVGAHRRRRTLLPAKNAGDEDRDRQNEKPARHDYSCATSFKSGSMDEGTVRDTCASTRFSNTASLAWRNFGGMPGHDEARDNAHRGNQQCPRQLVRRAPGTRLRDPAAGIVQCRVSLIFAPGADRAAKFAQSFAKACQIGAAGRAILDMPRDASGSAGPVYIPTAALKTDARSYRFSESFPNRAQRAEEMSFYGAFLHSGGDRNFEQVHVFHEA